MGLLDFLKSDEESMEIPLDGLVSNNGFNGYGKMKEEQAKKISALFSGVCLISETISSLPVYKYERLEDGSKVRVQDDKLNYLLNVSSNDYTSAFNMKNTFIQSAILKGNGYIYIKKDGLGNILGLYLVDPDEVTVNKVTYGKNDIGYTYNIKLNDIEIECKYHELINLARYTKNGVEGQGILQYGADVLGLAGSQNRFLAATLENGAYTKGIVSVPDSTKTEERQSLMRKFKEFFGGRNSGGTMVLPESIKYNPISLSPADLDVLKSSEFSIREIARLLKVPPHMIGDTSTSTYGNLEQSNLHFLQYCLLSYIRQIEEVLNHFLLLESEKNGKYFFEFNIDNLLRTDKTTEMNYYVKGAETGIFTLNEVRNKLNLTSIDGGDINMLGKFNAIIRNGEIINSNMGISVDKQLETPLD